MGTVPVSRKERQAEKEDMGTVPVSMLERQVGIGSPFADRRTVPVSVPRVCPDQDPKVRLRRKVMKINLKWSLLLILAVIMLATPAYSQTLTTGASQEVVPGVVYREVYANLADGSPVRGYVIDVDLRNPLLEVRPATPAKGIQRVETISSMAKRQGAVAAINGGFFNATGSNNFPIGNLLIDGKLLALSDIRRVSMGLTGDRTAIYGYFAPQYLAQIGVILNQFKVERINNTPLVNGLTLYTPEWGVGTGVYGKEVVVDRVYGQNRVVAVIDGYAPIPPRGYVLHFGGTSAELAANIQPGDPVNLTLQADNIWGNLRHLLTAGPLLVEGGRPVYQGVNEGFRGTFFARGPRTAVGSTADGHLLMVVVDGRQPNSRGVTLEEMSALMINLGADSATGMDNGGSSAMWVGGRIINRPSDGHERPVNNALLVFSGSAVYLDGQRLILDTLPQMVQGRVLVPLRAIFEAFNATVAYDVSSRAIRAVNGPQVIELVVGAGTAKVNGIAGNLDVPAQILGGRTLVPLRFVAEALGARVNWDAAAQKVEIYTN